DNPSIGLFLPRDTSNVTVQNVLSTGNHPNLRNDVGLSVSLDGSGARPVPCQTSAPAAPPAPPSSPPQAPPPAQSPPQQQPSTKGPPVAPIVGGVAVTGAVVANAQTPAVPQLPNMGCVSWQITGPCMCGTTPCVSVAYWEPFALIETVKQPGTVAL